MANPWGDLLAHIDTAVTGSVAADDPIAWAEGHGVELWSKQREVMAAVRDNRRTAARAGHGVSKSHTAALLTAWWVTTRPVGSALVVTTAPTQRQVSAILWEELRRMHARFNLPGEISLDATWRIDGQLVALGRKPADTDLVAFQGLHARHVLAILDEACGLPDQMWDVVEGVTTSATSRLLAIGNPTERGGRFEACFAPGSGWHPVHIPVTGTPAFTGEPVSDDLLAVLPSREWVDDARRNWGEDSAAYASRVLGDFPKQNVDALFTWDDIQAAQRREAVGAPLPVVIGCDVARYGDDQTVIAVRTGWAVRVIMAYRGESLTHTAGILTQLSKRFAGATVHVDDTGLGGGVTDMLRENGVPVHGIIAAGRASDPEVFANARAEGYWRTREALALGLISLDPDDDTLARQLADQRYLLDSRGRILIEPKDKIRARGGASPDRADAVSLTMVQPNSARFKGTGTYYKGM